MATDGGYDTGSLLSNAFTAALTAINSSNAVKNYEKLHRITQRLVGIEEDTLKHTQGVYWPAELQYLAEFSTKQAWDSADVLAVRYEGRLWPPAASMFAKRRQQLLCAAPRSCGATVREQLLQLSVEEAGARALAVTLARRIAFEETRAVGDTDFARRKQAVSIHQGLFSQAASLMAAAAKGYAGAAGNSAAAASASLSALGYLANRLRTGGSVGADALQNAPTRTVFGAADSLAPAAESLPTLETADLGQLPSFTIGGDAAPAAMDTTDYGGSI